MLRAIFQNDVRCVKKDPMVWAVFAMPFIMLTFYFLVREFVPLIKEYLPALQYMFIAMAGLMPGAIFGLRILEEKDEHILSYFAVTPFTLTGYYCFRMGVVLLLGMVETMILWFGLGIHANPVLLVYNALLSMLMLWLVGAVAKNKIQGMVFLKLFGVVVLLPCVRLLGENHLDCWLGLLPWDFLYREIVIGTSFKAAPYLYMLYAIGGILLFYRKSLSKA
ncbi:hypothetical protein [Anaerosporobacter faecicola]|uniref:hypothetical protein n=1 Tax=Anaerosporobacter faecicola TaxID=2718714 RepID=UPI001438D5B6|nr:hypothetical protein [Anaerosporobacter faecicola]